MLDILFPGVRIQTVHTIKKIGIALPFSNVKSDAIIAKNEMKKKKKKQHDITGKKMY